MTTALVIRSTLGSLFASSALPHLRALSSLLSSYGRVLCLRLDAGYERAFVYYDSAASSQAALDALPSRVPHLRAAAAPVVVLVEGLVVSSTVPLIEEYVYSCFSRFGAVLGVDVDVDAGEVRVYMQEQEPAERARLALHKTKVNAWIWRVSLTDDVPQSGTAEPSSSTSTPSPSAAIDVLPREVLLLIFSYLPPRGLLLALRLVSRKWSRIASHAIKSLASFSEIACVRLLRDPILTSQFRHLTHFTVSNATSAALVNKRNEWRASLRSLTLCHTSAVLPQFLSLDRITAITSLIPLSQFSLQAMAHSLVRLSLNLFNTAGDEGLALLHVPLLPNLSSLSVAAMQEDTRTEGLQSLLFRQRTTLTDLEILIHDHSPASYLPVHFPRLARLALDVDENDDTLDWLNAHFTSMRHLSLRCNEASVQRLSLDLLTSLRALHVRNADPLDACNLSQFLEPCVNLRHHTSTFKVESSKAISSRLYSLTLNEAIPGIERSFTALRELKVMGWSTTAHTMHLPHLETLRWLGHDRSLRSIELLERLINAFPTLRRLSFLLDGADLMTEFPLVRDHLGVHAPRLIRIEESLKLAENNGMLRVALPVLGTGKLPSEWRVRLTDMQHSLRWMDLLSFDVTEITDEDALGEVYSALRAYTHSGSSR